MNVIFGAGKLGREIRANYFERDDNVVFYDNDRRKWGSTIDGVEVITLDNFTELANKENTRIIIGCKAVSSLFFLRDVSPLCEVVKVEDDKIVPFHLSDIGEFPYDNAIEIGQRNLEEHIRRTDEFKLMGNMIAYNHAVNYVNFKKDHLHLPEISALEFTNDCNLKCPNCPNSTLTFHKGYMGDEVFEMALKYLPPYKDDVVTVHCMGEPLLHPKCITYLERLAELEINICMSTNGILLDDNMNKEILSIFGRLSKTILYISFHSRKSVENWFKFLQLFKKMPENNIFFRGRVLEHNQEEAYSWLKEFGIDNPQNHPYIQHITSHSFAGNVPGRRTVYKDIEVSNRIRNCYYLRQRKVAVMWDGTLRGCCYDSNAEFNCGNIFDFENATIDPKGYALCKCCDPDWITRYQ